jgi:hypothetical protein
MKKIILVFIILAAACGGILYWQYSSEGKEINNNTNVDNYNIFGESEFETTVEGYFKAREVQNFDSTISAAYLVITKFGDDEFKAAMEEGVAQGNTVNRIENGMHEFNLGCFKDGKIEGIEYEVGKVYMDDSTQEEIVNSSLENPVPLILSFGYHPGRGCDCCNLAHSVRMSDRERNQLVSDDFSMSLPLGWSRVENTVIGVSEMAANLNENISEAAALAINFRSYLTVSQDSLQAKIMQEYMQSVKAEIRTVAPNVNFLNEGDIIINGNAARAIEADMTQQGIDFKVLIVAVKENEENVWVLSYNTLQSSWGSCKEDFSLSARSFVIKK